MLTIKREKNSIKSTFLLSHPIPEMLSKSFTTIPSSECFNLIPEKISHPFISESPHVKINTRASRKWWVAAKRWTSLEEHFSHHLELATGCFRLSDWLMGPTTGHIWVDSMLFRAKWGGFLEEATGELGLCLLGVLRKASHDEFGRHDVLGYYAWNSENCCQFQ